MRQILSDPRAREKPCLRCGRSLKKNLDDRHCPDCGLSLWISLNPNDSLEWSNAAWLRRTALGAWISAGAQLIAIAAYATVGLASARISLQMSIARAGEVGDPGATRPTYDATAYDGAAYADAYYAATSVPIAVAAVLIGVYFLVNALGVWLLSTHEQRFPDRSRTARLWARIAVGVSSAVGVGMIALGAMRLHGGWPVHTLSSWLVLIACEVVFAGSACCAWLILRRVARRAGKGPLAKLCGYLLFLPVLAFAKAAPFVGLFFLAVFGSLLNLLPIVYLPLSVYLFVRFALLLQRAIPEAERAWASETRVSP